MTEGSKDNILKGMYVFKDDPKAQVDLIGSGSILREVIKAATILADDFGVTSKILSLTSVKELYKEAIATERAQKMDTSKKGLPFVTQILGGSAAIAVVATDYVRAVPDMLARFCPKPFYTLGTDGFGRSEAREELRDYFEVDAKSIAYTALYGLWKQGLYSEKHLKEAMKKLGIDPNKKNSLNT